MNPQREISRFDPGLAIESAPTPPSSWYLQSDILEQEKLRLLLATWQPVARLEQVAQPGSFVSDCFLEQPWIITRDASGQLGAFYNVCRHHAALVVEGQGCAQQLTCPYHGWTYDLNGQLRKAPKLGAVKEFDRTQYGLRPIHFEVWGPWIWLNFSPQPEPLASQLAPLAPLADWQGLSHVLTRSYEIECNWKVYVDNYLDGGYHVEVAHKNLASQLDLTGYRTQVLPNLVLQTCSSDGSSDRLGGGAVYAWLYPNWMYNRYGDILDTNWVIPLGPERCLTVFDYFFVDPTRQDFIQTSLEASHQVQLEDIAICESVQKGLRSQGYDVGRYAPALEIGEYAFHQWLHRDLSR